MPDGGTRYAYPPRRLRVAEAARYVGVSETIFRALALPAVKIGSTVGWLKEDLDAWLDSQAGRATALPQAAPETQPETSYARDPIAAGLANLAAKRRPRRQDAAR